MGLPLNYLDYLVFYIALNSQSRIATGYFAPYISPYSSSYSTRRSQSGCNFLVIPKFQPSIHKSVKQFGHSFAFDAPTIWNALPDEIRASSSLASFRKRLKTHLYTKAYPP